jgi:MerR family transcriptional regulator, heat shock protein HspR
MTKQHPNTPAEQAAAVYDGKMTVTLTGVTVACLTRYERAHILTPTRIGRRRMYRAADLARIRRASRLEHDLGINLPGVDVILRLTEEMSELQRRLAQYESPNRNSAQDGARRIPERTRNEPNVSR